MSKFHTVTQGIFRRVALRRCVWLLVLSPPILGGCGKTRVSATDEDSLSQTLQAKLAPIQEKLPKWAVGTNPDYDITNILAELEGSLTNYAIKTKSYEDLMQLSDRLSAAGHIEQSFNIAFYAKLKQYTNAINSPTDAKF